MVDRERKQVQTKVNVMDMEDVVYMEWFKKFLCKFIERSVRFIEIHCKKDPH